MPFFSRRTRTSSSNNASTGSNQSRNSNRSSNNTNGSVPMGSPTANTPVSTTAWPPPNCRISRDAAFPGAFLVHRQASREPVQPFRVVVPQGVAPGGEFSVSAAGQRARVTCPPQSRPGDTIQINIPPKPITLYAEVTPAPLTAPPNVAKPLQRGQNEPKRPLAGGYFPMVPEVYDINQTALSQGGVPQTHVITVPPNIQPGMTFLAHVEGGQKFMVVCPPHGKPDVQIRIIPPHLPEEKSKHELQTFQVVVPEGVVSGQTFALVAQGQRVVVTCPPRLGPGRQIRFQLPVAHLVRDVNLKYEGAGWSRRINVQDMQFQWVRKDDALEEVTVLGKREEDDWEMSKFALVRKISFLEGNDIRLRTGQLELIPAQDASVASKLTLYGKEILNYADVCQYQGQTLADKTEWFQSLVSSKLIQPWEDGHVRIIIRRQNLLPDSVKAVMSLSRSELHQRWRMEFYGEPGLEAGGLSREWFHLVTEQLYDADSGLWLSSANNQMCLQINPASDVSCPEDHLVYFRFLGRILGRALLDRQVVRGHMTQTIYKYLLGWPITFGDIQNQDEGYYQSLRQMTQSDDVSMLCIDFTATEDRLGERVQVSLKEDGENIEVTNENLTEYLEASFRYRMLTRVQSQLTELLLGFYDVIPEPLLTVFDANELELLLCGLPEIDLKDWKANTRYTGLLVNDDKKHNQIIKWFWEIVEHDFDAELRARLLQFATGTSGVPSRGFSVLQGMDGNIKKFTIHGVDTSVYYPMAHTCFNRIDVPIYDSKKTLEERLKTAVTMSNVGFGID